MSVHVPSSWWLFGGFKDVLNYYRLRRIPPSYKMLQPWKTILNNAVLYLSLQAWERYPENLMTKIQPWSNFLDLCHQLCKCYLMTKMQPWSNFLALCNQFCKCKMWSMFRHPWWFQRRQRSNLHDLCDVSIQTKITHLIQQLVYMYILCLSQCFLCTRQWHDNTRTKGCQVILRGEDVGRRHYLICGGYNDGRFMRYLLPNDNLTLQSASHLLFGMSSFQHKRPPRHIERMLEAIKTSFLICAILPARVL